MAKRKRDSIEYRYYELGQDECVLALFGESWIREYGKDIDGKEIDGFHFHNLMEIGICRDGKGEMSFEDGKHAYRPGMITLIPKNLAHNTISEEGKKSFWEYLFLDPVMLLRQIFPNDEFMQTQILEKLNQNYQLILPEQSTQCTQMINLIIHEMSCKEKYYKNVLVGLCGSLILELYRLCIREKQAPDLPAQGSRAIHLKAVFEHIDEAYVYPELRVETLADICGLSETHFRRVFKEQTGMTPAEYVNLVRIQHACELMRKTNMNMDEISAHVGFESTTSFTRNFKKFLDITPYQWKKNPSNYEGKILEYNVSVIKGW